ncbi:hypothetical protein T265_00172 [Opisthorchis viverrini]|uniref:Large ribosomal subunit protein eL39 n=1 Tax=Opisthorchis viverrini TaxID=6198 RepID=A0A075A4M7_OPIVI|nr:hypothetical protein T265_00172 [Opisthorchis viverrini]KER34331.1 hypothetical protein T265_00172 [Opisthorchis viverrini]
MASEVAFVEKFVGVSFSSFTAFEMTLNQYMKDNFVIFRQHYLALRMGVLQMQQAPSKKNGKPWNPKKLGSHKTLRMKTKLGKKQKQNRTLPHWTRLRTGNKIRYNAKRRHWRRTKLKL